MGWAEICIINGLLISFSLLVVKRIGVTLTLVGLVHVELNHSIDCSVLG